ncbi:helix-turn-helix domain-containing protein [Vibrio vulnificus]|nr:helix-turn-helix domain-containing protein [Vibrio vulnificus]EKG2460367.1 helix-turn-helix domain-containing protein [Vibrio vulnificus]
MTEKTAYRLASEGKLPGFKVGGSWHFKEKALSETAALFVLRKKLRAFYGEEPEKD